MQTKLYPAKMTLVRSVAVTSEISNVRGARKIAVSRLEKLMVWTAIKLRIFYFALIILKKPKLVWQTFREMLRLRNNVWGGDLKKLYRVDGKYYFNMYTPGWPSKAYDQLIKAELRRRAS